MISAQEPGLYNVLKHFGISHCTFEERLANEEVVRRAKENPEMWEFLSEAMLLNLENTADLPDLDTTSASAHAAIMLNDVLWTHSGGWANTFG